MFQSSRGRIPAFLVVALTGAVAGCSSSSHGTATAAAKSSAAASAHPSASVSAKAAKAAPGTSGTALRPAIGATTTCDSRALLAHASLASGAVHHYLAREDSHGRVTVVALHSSSARRTAAKAAGYAAGQLTDARNAVAGCASTRTASGIAGQTADYLDRLASRLRSGSASVSEVSAAPALIADVGSQLSLLKLRVADQVPPASSL